MSELHQFVSVEFHRFKAFDRFVLLLKHFNILVGPNNAGKSTVLAAFRILAAALRKAWARKPEYLLGPHGHGYGYVIDLKAISIAEENIFYNYDDSEPAFIRFKLSNQNELILYFPEVGACYLFADTDGPAPRNPTAFEKLFNCPIGFVPILGPVDHDERLYREEAARLALFNYTAARNFRNIWYHYPDKFDQFRELLIETWPGMDIERPTVDYSSEKPLLHMFCPEERYPREIFWAGFGFQVWCQMLTHLVQSSDKALFLIDEPDIYLHSDLQRQLLGILRNLGPDIIIATHSVEIISEAEPDDIILIDKKRIRARRIKNPSELVEILALLGSNLNPILTQLAKTRRVVFVEGKDFQIFGKFARKLGSPQVGNRTHFAVVPVEGFNPERIHNLIRGMEKTLGGAICAAAILDRDYRSDAECESIAKACNEFCDLVVIHRCKEIENFLLSPPAIDRAAQKKVSDQVLRSGKPQSYEPCSQTILDSFSEENKAYVTAQYIASRRKFERSNSSHGIDEATANEAVIREFEQRWSDKGIRLGMIPGKDALSTINKCLQDCYGINVTPTAIIDSMRSDEIPIDIRALIDSLSEFTKKRPRSRRN